MSVFSYHIVELSFFSALRAMMFPLKRNKAVGLIHAETMTIMKLGSSILSFSRFFNTRIVVFAQWEDEASIDRYLQSDGFGRQLANGWHVRLEFLRQWGKISGYEIPDHQVEFVSGPVVAVTLARMKYTEIPRFIMWGRPVEKLVRDHKGTTLSLASIRHPNTVSTFSIWKSQKEMTDMVHGHSKMPQPKRHIDAMRERDRKDFHFEFTTLRFRPISEHGTWNMQANFVPRQTES
jgi:hypothetical protein